MFAVVTTVFLGFLYALMFLSGYLELGAQSVNAGPGSAVVRLRLVFQRQETI